jgi:hypothetical protein
MYIQSFLRVYSTNLLSLMRRELQHCGTQLRREYVSRRVELQIDTSLPTMHSLVELSSLLTRQFIEVKELQ